MTLDIRGSKKTTRISDNRFIVFEELLSNAIDSYLIRKNETPNIPPLDVRFQIDLYTSDMFTEDTIGVQLICKDNGAGLGDKQVKAFVTKDSTFKDDLKITGIGKCFGSGRVQYFHFFDHLSITSIYQEDNKCLLRELDVASNTKEISENSFRKSDSDSNYIETKITLKGLASDAYKAHFALKSLLSEFSPKNIKHHLLITFLQRFVTLKNIVGDFNVQIETSLHGVAGEPENISELDLPLKLPVDDIFISCVHGNEEVARKHKLSISTYPFPEVDYPGFEHDVALCANSSIVKSLSNKFLKVKKDKTRAIDGKFYLILIESDYLENRVNVRRDNFEIPVTCRNMDAMSPGPSMEDIIDSIEDYVLELLTPTDFDREALISETGTKFGISTGMLAETRVKVKYGDTADMIAKRVLKKYQEEIVDDTSNIFEMKQNLLALDPRLPDFRDSVSAMSWKYTSTIKKMDMANLSQLVVRRSAMLEILRSAITGMLSVQENNSGRNENERIIHNIFFPTGKDNSEQIEHDIWILNEEYHYFEHIASDKSLSSIPWDNNEKLFESDIDTVLEEAFKKNETENRLKRPDIAIFNQEGSAIIIEFKAPGVEVQEHTGDLMEYAHLLAAKSKGRIKKFYGYLIGDTINPLRLRGYNKFPSGNGWFGTEAIQDSETGRQYGELYSEILFYHDFVDRAEQRLKIYKDKLGIG
jgi:hypothetical protein